MSSLPRELYNALEFSHDSSMSANLLPDTGGTDDFSQSTTHAPRMGYWQSNMDAQLGQQPMLPVIYMMQPMQTMVPVCVVNQIPSPIGIGNMCSNEGATHSPSHTRVCTIMHPNVGVVQCPNFSGKGSMIYSNTGASHPDLQNGGYGMPSDTASGYGRMGIDSVMYSGSTPMHYSGLSQEYVSTCDTVSADWHVGNNTCSNLGTVHHPSYGGIGSTIYSDMGTVHQQTLNHHQEASGNGHVEASTFMYSNVAPTSHLAHIEMDCAMTLNDGLPNHPGLHHIEQSLGATASRTAQTPIEAISCCPARRLASENKEAEEITRNRSGEIINMVAEEEDKLSITLTFEETYDSRSVISSDASTVVSRSARRRRGRRAAKARAAQVALSTIPIMESPALDEILVSEEMKTELSMQLKGDDRERRAAFSQMRGSVCRMAFEPYGCWVVQLAIEVANGASEQQSLVAELHGNVRAAISSPHANFVIQKMIEVLPIKSTNFVAEELLDFAAEAARHRYGCRIICRLVEHHLTAQADSNTATIELIDELLLEAEKLIHHSFARHVIEEIIEHGSRNHQQTIARAARNDIFRNAKSRYASYVVEQVLKRNDLPEGDALASDLVGDLENFLALACHECGSHVIKALLKSRGRFADHAKEMMHARIAEIRASRYGQRLLDEIE